MKKFRLLIIFGLIIGCLALMVACGNPALSKPTNLKIDDTTLTLSWNEVEGTELYTVSIKPENGKAEERIVSKESYSLSQLSEGKYTIKIKANGKKDVSEDSDWATIPFTREHETGLAFSLINNGTEYEVTSKGSASGDIVIPATYRNKPVTSIKQNAFMGKNDVFTVSFAPDSKVKTIGNFAFNNCTYLTSVTFPESLESIGQNAFASCRLLEGTLVLPQGITEIPEKAFSYCAKITDIQLGNKVTTIGDSAFNSCDGLTSVTLPDSVTTIGISAFADCENLTEINFGANLETIGDYAFSDDALIEELVLPEKLVSIGLGSFLNCAGLTDVSVNDGLQSIGHGAFLNSGIWIESPTNEVYVGNWLLGFKDTEDTQIDFKEGTHAIADNAFYQNTSLQAVVLPNSVEIIGLAAFAASNITSIIIGSGVKALGEQAFIGCESLINVILGSYDDGVENGIDESSLEVIGEYAFRECIKLDKIEIPDTVKTVSSYAFRNSGIYNNAEGGVVYADNWLVDYTAGLQGDVDVKDGTVGIANYAFVKCTGLTGITIPASVKTIGKAAFYQCELLTSVDLPDTLEVIEDYTFYYCKSLKLFELPSSLVKIGRSAFYKCGTLYTQEELENESNSDTLVIPNSVQSIGDYAFYGCGYMIPGEPGVPPALYGIDILIIGNGVETIGANAFYEVTSLRRVTFGESVETIGEKAFYKCTALAEISFNSGLVSIGTRAFYKCSAIEEVYLPSSVTEIGDYAFYKCLALDKLSLVDGLTDIGSFAFYGCEKLTELYIPKTVSVIGKQAFRNCKGLLGVALGDSIVSIGEHAFYGCPTLTLYTELRSAAEGWSALWNSGYRPVVWGCTLSENNDYVVSFTKTSTNITNKNTTNAISSPTRVGHVFLGWGDSASDTEPAYTSETLMDAPNGKTLYAIWDPQN